MSRRFFLCALLTVSLYYILSQAYALECEKESISIRADAGNYAYGELACTSYSDLFADYEGNMSNDIRIFVTGTGNNYKIGLLADATRKSKGSYKGKIILINDDGEELDIDTRVRVGDGSDEEITLSKYGLSFEIDKPDYVSCYTIAVENTGNAELNDLHAEYTEGELVTLAYSNKSWIYFSGAEEQEFAPGQKTSLEICVNPGREGSKDLPEKHTIIAVVADGSTDALSEEIEITLRTDLDTSWKKSYDLLMEQHKELERNYSEMRTYKETWNERYANGTDTMYTYSALSKVYKELKTAYAVLEKKLNASNYSDYEKLSGQFSDIDSRYRALQANYTRLKAIGTNMSDKAEADALTNESERLKENIEELKPSLEDLRSRLEEKDAILAAMQAKQKRNDSAAEKTNANTGKGFVEEYVPILAVPFALIAIAVIIIRTRKKHAETKKETGLKIHAIKKDPGEEIDADIKREEERKLREQQKDALRQLLMQKLAEKNAERK
jgi:hypothetical protein